jgi:histidine ammonia-lyase
VAVVLTGSDLTIEEVVRVARHGESVELAPSALDRMRASRAVVEEVVDRGEEIYGFTTGVGMRKRFAVEGEMASFNRMLISGHLIGQGPAAPEDIVRAMMTGLANGLAQGAAGARPELAQLVVDALNAGVTPRVRLLGSVGQADLSANADLAEGLIGDFALSAGEGLALLNNNMFSTGIAALAVEDATALLDSFDVAGALDLEAFAGNPGVLHAAVAEARPYPGLRATLTRLRSLLEDSFLWDGPPRNLQDPLSFRTIAQVHGAARDALAYAGAVVEVELNAHQGNPLVIVEEKRILSVGNFDVVPLAAALDFLRIALAPVLTSAAERALKLLQAPFSGLPEGLGAHPGLAEPALSEFGAAVQAIAAEARLLAQPVSFELASTSQHEGIEDRTTMAPLAARRLAEMVELGARVMAIELTIAAQAVDLRGRPALGAGTRRAFELVRERVPFTDAGQALPADLEPLVDLVRSGALEEKLRRGQTSV